MTAKGNWIVPATAEGISVPATAEGISAISATAEGIPVPATAEGIPVPATAEGIPVPATASPVPALTATVQGNFLIENPLTPADVAVETEGNRPVPAQLPPGRPPRCFVDSNAQV